MPSRRKISISDALAALDSHGIAVSVTKQPESTPHPMDISPEPKILNLSKGHVKITLYANHSLSNGGQQNPGTKTITGSGNVSYGPGVVVVPTHLAAQLLKQDQVTRLGDEKTRSTELRSFIVVQRQGLNGYKAKIAVQVPNEVLDHGFDLTKISQSNEHNVRTM